MLFVMVASVDWSNMVFRAHDHPTEKLCARLSWILNIGNCNGKLPTLSHQQISCKPILQTYIGLNLLGPWITLSLSFSFFNLPNLVLTLTQFWLITISMCYIRNINMSCLCRPSSKLHIISFLHTFFVCLLLHQRKRCSFYF